MEIVSAKRVLQSEWQKQGVPFYRAREIARLSENGFVNNELFISREHYESLKKAYGVPCVGDIMISAVGTIGKCYIVRERDRFYYKDASVLCLRNNFDLSPEYVLLYLQSSLARQQMFEESKGTTVDTITIEKASNYFIPIPPLAEQRRIVNCTDIILKKVEELTAQAAAIKELVQETKDKILENAIKGKLVPQNHEEEPAIEELRRINPSFQPSDNLHYEGDLPKGWTCASFDDLFDTIPAKPYQVLMSEIKSSGTYPVISQGANYIDGYSDCVEKHLTVTNPIIIFGDHSKVLKYVDFDFIVGADGVKILVPKVLPKYAYYHLLQVVSRMENRGYSRNFRYLSSNSFLVPPFKEQQRIVSAIEQILTALSAITK